MKNKRMDAVLEAFNNAYNDPAAMAFPGIVDILTKYQPKMNHTAINRSVISALGHDLHIYALLNLGKTSETVNTLIVALGRSWDQDNFTKGISLTLF